MTKKHLFVICSSLYHMLISSAAILDVTTEVIVTMCQTHMLPSQPLIQPQALVSGCLQTQVDTEDSFS